MKLFNDKGQLEFSLEYEDLVAMRRVENIMFQLRLYNRMSEDLRQRCRDADALLEELIKTFKAQ